MLNCWSRYLALKIGIFKYYGYYKYYKIYKMENTTIAIKSELKKELMEFGMKGESYNEILERLIKSAKERQLHDLLFNEEDTVTLEEAKKEVENEWSGS